jgi:hypothetical protein
MPVVGTLKIDIVAGTASFESDMSKASGTARHSAKEIQDSLNKMDIGEARGGLMLIDDLLGVHLPRHAVAFASAIPGLMQAAAAAMPVAAIAAIGIGIMDAVDKIKERQDQLRLKAMEVASSWEESGMRIRAEMDAQTAKIIAFSQGPMAAFDFSFEHAASVAIAHLKEIQSTIKETGDEIVKNSLLFSTGEEEGKKLIQFGALLRSTMDNAEENSGGNKFAAINAGLQLAATRSTELQGKIDGIKTKMERGDAGGPFWNSLLESTQAEANSIDQVTRNLLRLSNLQSSTNAAKKTEGQQVAFGQTQKVAGLDLGTQLADIGQLKSAAVLAFVEMGTKIDQAKTKADSMFSGQELQAHLDYFSRLENAGGSFEERTKIAADKKIFLDKEMATASEALAAVLSKNTELTQSMQETAFKQASDNNKEIEKELMATASAKTRAMIGVINMTRAETDEEARASAIQQVHAFQRIDNIQTEIKQLQKLRDAAIAKGEATLAYDAAIANAQHQRQRDLASELVATGRLGNVFKGTMLQMAEEGKQWQLGLANTFKQTMGGMNSSLAAFAVTGQGDFRQLAVSALESFIQVGLAWVESKLMMAAANAFFGDSQSKQTTQTIAQNAAMAISAAGLAAANTLAYTSAIFLPPIPEGLSAAAFATGLTYAGFASAERGALLPNRDMMVHTHPQEMILPRPIANFVVDAASRASGSGKGGHNFYISPVFAPVIKAIDASGVEEMLIKHHDKFHNHLMASLRSLNY